MTAHDARERHPSAGPQAEARDRLVAVFRACRQMPAAPADQWRKRVAIDPDQPAAETARKVKNESTPAVILDARDAHSAACRCFASIWLIASTTASKVSMVEAWRAW